MNTVEYFGASWGMRIRTELQFSDASFAAIHNQDATESDTVQGDSALFQRDTQWQPVAQLPRTL